MKKKSIKVGKVLVSAYSDHGKKLIEEKRRTKSEKTSTPISILLSTVTVAGVCFT